MDIILIALSVVTLVVLGVIEKKQLQRNVEKIPLRINVNGIRGKSTATRFITAILEEAGYRVVGKTTGTAARFLTWGHDQETVIKRPPIGPNIGEQVSVVKKAAKLGADALVCECMAVKPEYQEVYQHQIIQANVVVITNVVEDHLDEMGPTTDQIAWAFEKTIPNHGILVITEGPYAQFFRRRAAKRGTKVVCIDPKSISDEYIDKFPYIVFKNNCAIALGVAKALGIDEEVAMRAMLKAHPDPGKTAVIPVERGKARCWLVNGFAANEPTSSLELWEHARKDLPNVQDTILVLCCRDDRIDRSEQFVRNFLPYIQADTMLVIGSGTKKVLDGYRDHRYPLIKKCVDLTGQKPDAIIQELEKTMDRHMVFCAGNIHGAAEKFLEKFAEIEI